MPGPGEWGTKGLHVGCLGILLKAPVPWHQDQNTQATWKDPVLHWELAHQILPGGLESGILAIASLLRLVSYILVSFPAEKIKTSPFFVFF